MRAGYPGRMTAAVGKGSFSPNKLANLIAWYDFTQAAYLTLTSTAITQALDRSGNGNNTAVQGTGTARPTFTTNQINGLSAAVFDGGDNLVLPANIYNIPSSGNSTVFVVSKIASETGSQQQVYSVENGTGVRMALLYRATAGNIGYLSNNAGGSVVNISGVTNTNFNILCGRRNGTTQALSFNNGAETTNASATDATVTIGYIGTGFVGTEQALTGTIAEVIVYNRSLSAAEITRVNRYLSNKYAITIS